MSKPQPNDTVSIVFQGKLDNGQLFYSTPKNEPMELQIGNSDLPPTLEEAIMKMSVGEQQKVRVPPEEGYGFREKNLVQVIDSKEMVESLSPKPGMLLSLKVDKEGKEEKVPATVIQVEGTEVTVDYNHPLAGHHLTYEVQLLAVK